ncbi:hypothetical protein QCA50_014021 [Cerrena zonata]|uniref:Uncharacterized protein n=1 Tax=Cerrena zonata TaxID=2478898 RepID=A0AAW0FMU6_9APHY
MVPIITNPLQASTDKAIPIGEYLFLRIAQANPKLRSIFGVPGDFNLSLIEHLYCDSVANHKNIRFLSLCNELNAAYAADGYAKALEGLSVLITTLGVGELSAINGIAGSFVEYSPVLHIVGTTSSRQVGYAESSNLPGEVKNIHHLLPLKDALKQPNHDVYKEMVHNVSVVQESLKVEDEEEVLVEKIDRVLNKIINESRPGYLFVPSDLSDLQISERFLFKYFNNSELNNEMMLNDIADRIVEKLYKSARPSIIGDSLMTRFNLMKPFDEFIDKLPTNFVKLFATNTSRIIDESRPNFVGTYYAKISPNNEIRFSLENETDLLITFGYYNIETNTGGYTGDFSKISDQVIIHPDYIFLDGEYISLQNSKNGERQFAMRDLMIKLNQIFDSTKLKHQSNNNIKYQYKPPTFSENLTKDITQEGLVDFFNHHLQEDDILMVETCSFNFAIPDLKFPRGVKFLNQIYYSSIGYALPATFGVCAAVKDLQSNRRVILIEGDGSAQMTIQELSSFLRFDVTPPQIFLLNNSGYTVERIIKGPTRSYNDIQDNWQWTKLLNLFGDTNNDKHNSATLKSMQELTDYAAKLTHSNKIEFMELILHKMDVPERFNYICGRKPMPN